MKVVIVQRLCPHYRRPLFRLLAQEPSLDLTLLTSDPEAKVGDEFSDFKHLNFPTSRLQFYWGVKRYLVPISPALLWHVWSSDYDVLVAEGVTNLIHNVFLFPICRYKGIKFVCWDAGRRRNAQRTIWRRLADPFFNWIVRGADACIAYSTVAAEYLKQVGAAMDKVFIAHNTIDVSDILQNTRDVECEAVLREKLGVTGHKIILFVGAVERRKKIEQLIEAFQLVRHSLTFPVSLLIIGEGDHLVELKTWTATKSLGEQVHFLGKIVDRVGKYFKLCDVFVLPSEGGLAINQAMAYGRAVIASSADGTEADLITNGWNGFLIEEDNIKTLSDSIKNVLTNPALAQQMGERARMRIQEKFTLPQMVQSFVRAIYSAVRK
jgi:glycosyltransferase involved in cell wall biosynthesis